MNLYQPTITGSLSVSGSVNISGSITIAGGGTISGTASIATTALTASSADNLLVRNTLTAQTLVVQTITSSVDFVTGSTRFGSIAANTHVFTGSMSVSGSFISTGSITFAGADLATDGLGNVNIFTTDAAATGRGGSLAFGGSTTGGTSPYAFAKIEGIYDGTAAYNGAMLFSTNNGGTITERMRIGSGGKVGISTSVAGDVLLNIVNGSSTGYGMNISAGSGSENYALRVENYNGASTLLYVRGDGNILINDTSANSYAKLQVTATSGVVLGLANPSAAAAGVGNVIQAWGTSGYNTLGEIDFLWDGASTTYAYMAFKTRGPSLLERMRITSGGFLEMRPITFSGVANNAIQTVFSSMGKGTWLVSVANDVDSTDAYVAMLWVRTNQIIEMQVFRADSMAFSYTNQDLKIQNLSGFTATLYVTAIRMAAS